MEGNSKYIEYSVAVNCGLVWGLTTRLRINAECLTQGTGLDRMFGTWNSGASNGQDHQNHYKILGGSVTSEP